MPYNRVCSNHHVDLRALGDEEPHISVYFRAGAVEPRDVNGARHLVDVPCCDGPAALLSRPQSPELSEAQTLRKFGGDDVALQACSIQHTPPFLTLEDVGTWAWKNRDGEEEGALFFIVEHL